VHFTAERGWINDPYGVIWTGDRYHLFFQYVPGRTSWSAACWWGHAESHDLVQWSEREPALAPGSFERGCWSGSLVLADARPVLFYTRITDDAARGAIATATGDAGFASWTSAESDVVVAGPPDGLDVIAFRDPFVFRHDDGWVMAVGCGLADGSGAVLQYRSPDLRRWGFDGVMCTHQPVPTEAPWAGAVWECPQLFRLGNDYVLVVSVWDGGEPQHVAVAIGDYDGHRFAAREWRRLTYGSCAYATSAFVDRTGQPCIISWLREEPRDKPGLSRRAGALSVPARVSCTSTGIALEPHPSVLGSNARVTATERGTGQTCILTRGAAVHLRVHALPGQRLDVVDNGVRLAVFRVAADGSELTVERPELPTERMPVAVNDPLQVVFDADIVEVFGPDGYGAFRIGVAADPDRVEIVLPAPHRDLDYCLL
jgi:beta-fructofuranosidase